MEYDLLLEIKKATQEYYSDPQLMSEFEVEQHIYDCICGLVEKLVSQKTAGIIDEEIEHEEDGEDDFDAEDYEEKRFQEECEYAANCTCGAWQFNKNNNPVHVADCICGNGL